MLREDVEQRRQEHDRTAVDERQVEPVADAETIEARARDPDKALVRGAAVHIKHAAAFRVSKRAHAVQCRPLRERRRRRPAAAEDHERHQRGQ